MPQNSQKAKSPEKHRRSKQRNAIRSAYTRETGRRWRNHGTWAEQVEMHRATAAE